MESSTLFGTSTQHIRKLMCKLCRNNGYITLPIGISITEGFLAKTNLAYKVCPLCQGRKIDVLSYPHSLEAKEYLVDYKVGSL